MKLPFDQVKKMYRELLETSGAAAADIDIMLEIKLDQDLHQNYFSGIQEVEAAIATLKRSVGKVPVLEVDKLALKLVKCNGVPTELVTAAYFSQLRDAARENGIVMFACYGGGYQGGLDTFARKIAAEDLVGIVSAAAGPACVTPYGGKTSISGTNPFAYGVPTNGLPIVFDAATAEYAYGTITRAKKTGAPLPDHVYLDKAGDWTTDAQAAVSIMPFGEHRGAAINLLIEVMGGALVRAKSGLLQKDEYDLGAFLIVIDPAAFGPLDEFKAQTTKLAEDIEAVQPAEGFAKSDVRVPGYKSERHKQTVLETGEIELDDRIWGEFKQTYDRLLAR